MATEQHVESTGPEELTPLQKAFLVIKQLRDKIERFEQAETEPIAIIGMGCRMPGGRDPESFWQLLRDGHNAVSEIPLERWNVDAYYDPEPGRPGKTYARHGGFLEQVDHFDAAFFGISGREAESIDPQQRLLLEVAWEALERAGLVPAQLVGSSTGVFIGVTSGDYGMLQVEHADEGQAHPYFNTGTPLNACAGRLSYTFGFQGPCMAVDTACSSSLSAIHLACNSLRSKECDQVLAGGVNLILTPRLHITLSAAGMMAPDGRCKTFDACADGYVRGEGCGLVVLKRYADAQAAGDQILAVIRGSAVNQDGASSGLTVPNGLAQQKLIRQALANAGVRPADIDYLEAHGTGTALGDPIEAQALGAVLGQAEGRQRPLLVGSVKSNIGHLESAAGVAGLIKLVQALRYEVLPPSLHLQEPNPKVNWETLRVQPVVELMPWPRGEKRRVAGLSSFGASGSNAHLIVEEAPKAPHAAEQTFQQDGQADRPMHVLALSAKSAPALRALTSEYQQLLSQDSTASLADICFSANTGRNHFKQRLAVAAADAEQARECLMAFQAGRSAAGLWVGGEPPAKPPRPVFLFSGQGAVYTGMGRELYATQPSFRNAIDTCAEILAPLLDKPLLSVLYPDDSADGSGQDVLEQASYVQPALFSLQYALTQLWRAWGVEPEAVLGHSLGEYCAACIAGVLRLEDALKLVVERARLMQTLSENGSMAAVLADTSRVEQMLDAYPDELSLAVVNGPQHVVIAGRTPTLHTLLHQLKAEGVQTHLLHVTHAFHSPLMNPMLDAFEQAARQIEYRVPELPFVSNLTGKVLAKGVLPDAAYWRQHCRQTVYFSDGLVALLEQNLGLFVEIGPGSALGNIGKRLEPSATWLPSLMRSKNDWSIMGSSLAELYVRGVEVDWAGFDAGFARRRVSVPTYVFQRQSYWIIPKELNMKDTPTEPAVPAQPVQTDREIQQQAILSRVLELISQLLRVKPAEVDIHAPFLEMGADSLVLVEGVRIVEDHFGVKLEIRQFFEEITTIAALAAYLLDRTTYGLPVAATTPLLESPSDTESVALTTQAGASPTPPMSVAVQPVATQPLRPGQVGPPVTAGAAVLSAAQATPGGTAQEQIVLAQMQLMSQQLAFLQGAPATPVATSVTQPAVAQQPMPQPAVKVNASSAPPAPAVRAAPPAAPSAEDRSSPLRALSNPISPGASGLTEQQQRHLAALIDRYEKKTPQSKELAQACRPGLADSRASIGFRFSTKEILYPITGAESLGSRLRDIDGNTYVDLTMGFGVLLFGSRPEFIQEVIEAEIQRGIQLGPRSDLMYEVTELFTQLTGHDRVAFTNSGTEAVMIALRLARTATNRTKIALFEGAYHGHSDGTLAKTIRVDGELRSEPVAPGVPANVAKDVLVLEYGTPETLEILRDHADELAAILVEPVQSRRLDLQPVEFLRQLRTLTEESGAALIFDEMISGFRAHPGGLQALFGIQADIATYGKIIGGGMPIGAVAGKRHFLDGIDGGMWEYGDKSYPSATRTYFGGTFCQHPFAMAACRATLRHLKAQGPRLQERLNQRTADFAQTLNTYFEQEKLPLRVSYFSSVFRFEFSGNLELLYYHLLEKGVYIWEWRNCFLSTAHTDEDLELVIQAVKDSVEEMRQGGFLPPAHPDGGKPVESGSQPIAPSSPASANGAQDHSLSLSEDPRGFWYRSHAKPSHTQRMALETPLRQPSGQQTRQLTFGLSFFGPYTAAFADDKYNLLLEGARFADREGFQAVWVPERHFHEFGGFSPNPSILAAVLARETDRVQLRAGSVVLPLHHPIRVAEEWSVVDNLSGGRVGIAFASGWHANDFVFAPDSYSRRRESTFEGLETVRQLWRGEKITVPGGNDTHVEVGIYPLPKQTCLPVWLTIVNNPDTYRKAGELGVGVLTNLMGQSLDDLATHIALYRQALIEHGHDPRNGHVSVLIHTYLCADAEQAIEEARQPLCDYLLSSMGLFERMADSNGLAVDLNRVTPADKAYLVQTAYEKYVASRALIGSPESCAPIVERLIDIGVDELACFIDFGAPPEAALAGLSHLNLLRKQYEGNGSKHASVAKTSDVQPQAIVFPLSEAQKQLWILAKLSEDGSRSYNDPAALLLRGRLDASALQQALEHIIARHESLRTSFDETGAQQVVHPWQALAHAQMTQLTRVDLSAEDDPEEALEGWLLNHNQRLFDFVHGPLFEASLIKLAAERHVLVLSAHHIMSDGPSMATVLNEIMMVYTALRTGGSAELEPPLQYRDFVAWQQGQTDTDVMIQHEAYWLQQFAGPLPSLALPSDRPRPAVQTYHGAREWLDIEPRLWQALRKVGSAHGSTLYMVLIAVYAVLLHRLSGQDRVIIGAPYTGRGLEGGDTLVGYCIHLLPIDCRLDEQMRFSDYLRRIRGTLLDAYEHQDYPFARLIDKLHLQRDMSRPPLLSTIFNLERQPGVQEAAELQVEIYPQPISYARVDLTLTVNLRDTEMLLECDYNTDLFEDSTIQRLLGQYQTLLEAVAINPEQDVARLPLLTASEQRTQLQTWNQTEPAASPGCLHTALEAQVTQYPDRIALIETDESVWTYSDLNRRANQVAHYLRSLGVGPDQRVGICLERSCHLLVAILGVLKAGGAYVPMDPGYPGARLALMLSDAEATVLLTQATLDSLPELQHQDVEICCLDRDRAVIHGQPDSNLVCATQPGHLAYVIYTSGSTGKPKGVMIAHHALMNYLEWAVQAYQVADGEGAPVLGSIGFDATITSLFVPLLAGRPVVLLPEGRELEALTSAYAAQRTFSFVKLTPAHLEILNTIRAGADHANAAAASRTNLTRYLVLGGEALAGTALEPWFQSESHPETDLRAVNEYGPTETVVGCCTYEVCGPVSGAVPIGRPIQGARLYILDSHLQLAPPGVVGELYIGGVGLARGYLGQPELTASTFIPDPFAADPQDGDMAEPGARLYKTGDLARYLPDGNLVFVGRADRQVKLHGFRIELGEIEAILAELPEVREAVVMVREDQPGAPRLVAYVCPAQGTSQAPAEDDDGVTSGSLRRILRSMLPEYMIPSVIVPMAELPLTAHGKVDHQALPAPDLSRPEQAAAYEPASSEVERQLVTVWQEVLSLDKVGIHDNFFDMGGNSLLLLQVYNQMEHTVAKDCPVIEFFKYPTIASLASYLSRDKTSAQADYRPVQDRVSRQRAATRSQAMRRRAQRR